MLPQNLSVVATDVLRCCQKKERVFVAARSYSAISLRYETSGKYICNKKAIPYEPVSLCIVPEGVAYERNNREEELLVIIFKMMNYRMNEIQVFKVNDGEKYKNLFLKALKLKTENEMGSNYRITAVLYEILAELTRDVGFTSNPKDNRIIHSAEYMRQNFCDPTFSTDHLAGKINLSPAYFRREFNRIFGTSPKKYLDNLRIEYAKTLLETDYFSQKEISARCGFSDPSYFRTAFKRKVGKTIREYIKENTAFKQ